MKIELWPIDRPKPYGRNPRNLSDKSVAKVAASIKEFGFWQPLVVDGKNVIIVGHKRFLAAKRLEMTHVPVIIADNLPPAKVKAYRLADNRTADEGEWNDGLLADELNDLLELGESLDVTAFDPEEIAEILPGEGDDEAAEVPPEDHTVVARKGDQWRLGPHTLTIGANDDRHIDLTIKRWQHYSGEAGKLHGRTFREVAADRARDAMGSEGAPAAGLAPKGRAKGRHSRAA